MSIRTAPLSLLLTLVACQAAPEVKTADDAEPHSPSRVM